MNTKTLNNRAIIQDTQEDIDQVKKWGPRKDFCLDCKTMTGWGLLCDKHDYEIFIKPLVYQKFERPPTYAVATPEAGL
jgi:hypothetical protein